VYVHGWQAPGGDSDYSLSSWVISATPGGSLTLDAAPQAAVLGETGTVAVSWRGLTAGTPYLGAVSHSNANGLIGLTLVEIDPSAVAAVEAVDNTAQTSADNTPQDVEALDRKVFLPLVNNAE